MAAHHQSRDLIDILIADHREAEEVFTELERGQVAPERKKELVDHTITELIRHAVAEEHHIYPLARQILNDGEEIADHEVQEHAEAEQVMKKLEGMKATDERYDALVGDLISTIRHHVQEEENDLLPKLRAACSHEQLEDLGRKVEEAKRSAPTRPHPSAPDKPPANRILDPGVGMIDRMRDTLSRKGS